MTICEMSKDECLHALAEAKLARLACAHDNQPYVVPVYVAYHAPAGCEGCLYGFTTSGQKVEWMRANPRVCVEVDEVAEHDRWVSVVVLGRYEELTDAPVHDGEQILAHWVLKARDVLWWEPAVGSRARRNPADPFTPVYYRIRIDRVTGRKAIRTPERPLPAAPASQTKRWGWVRAALARAWGGGSNGPLS